MRVESALPPLVVAIPLVAAAIFAALSSVIRERRIFDAAAIMVSVAVAGMCIGMMVATATGPELHWFGGWTPRNIPSLCHPGSCAVGVDFAVDPLGAGMASLVAVLVTCALLFSWRYFEQVGSMYHVLMLTFLAGMVGFSLTGDLFDMFVFFEVMGVSAYALTAYRIEEQGPVQGALNFAVTNSIGAYLILMGIGLLYARTGALNLLQIGQSLGGHADALVVTAWALVMVGFLVKAAIVPFHFWLADAHAAAPTPACILFSGAMVELGLYAVARIHWTVFAPALGSSAAIHGVLIGFGVVTAVVGAALCFSQHHLKRLLAFSTVSHAGMFLCGLALFTPLGLGAASVYVLGHGLVKGALFIGAGILVHRFQNVDEAALMRRGKQAAMGLEAALFVVGALALAGLPPFVTYAGKGLLEDAALSNGLPWLIAVFVGASAVTAGAWLRVTGRIFLGLDDEPPPDAAARHEGHEEESGAGARTPATMLVPMGALLATGCAAGLLPQLFAQAQLASARLFNTSAYAQVVLNGAAPKTLTPSGALEPTAPTLFHAGTGAAAAVGAVLMAVAAWNSRRGPRWMRAAATLSSAVMRPLRRMHSGDVRDYVAWLVLGVGVLGGALALIVR